MIDKIAAQNLGAKEASSINVELIICWDFSKSQQQQWLLLLLAALASIKYVIVPGTYRVYQKLNPEKTEGVESAQHNFEDPMFDLWWG